MLIGIDGNEANIDYRVGSNQYAYEILRGIYKIVDCRKIKKNKIIIYLKDKPREDLPKETDWWKYRVIGPRRFWTQFRLPLELFFCHPRPDVFFTPGHYAPRWLPMPLVVSIMDLGYLHFPQQFIKRDLYTLNRWTKRSIYKAEHILAISEFTRNDIIRTYQIDRKKITVTPLGYDKDKYKAHQDKFKIDLVKKRYRTGDNYLLFLGTLKPSKNVVGLIGAFAKITNKVKQLNLVIAGKKGWLFESIYNQVKNLNLEKKVVFTGFIEEEDLPLLMAGSKVFCFPSLWEGFGIPVLEAMASGVPVVISRVASLPEVVGKAGVLVDPKDCENIANGILKALKNSKKLIPLGLTQVEKFSWEKCCYQTLAVFESFIKTKN